MAVLTAALVAVHLSDPLRGTRAHPAGWLFVPFIAYAAANVLWVTPVRWLGWFDWLIWAQTAAIFVNLEQVKVEWMEKETDKIRAVITTPVAVFERSTKIIRGDEEVHFRSGEMDADGIGFDADQEKQTIHIRSKVKVLLKGNLQASNPANSEKQQLQ